MDRDRVEHAVVMAQMFIQRASQCIDEGELNYGKQSGALRRQSMELTRALAEMRKP